MRKFLVIAAALSASTVAFSINAPNNPLELRDIDFEIPGAGSSVILPFGAGPGVTITPTGTGNACASRVAVIAPSAPKKAQRCGNYTVTPEFGSSITGTWVFFNHAKPAGGWNAGNIYFRNRLMMVPDTGTRVLWTSRYSSNPAADAACSIDPSPCSAPSLKFCGDVEFYNASGTLRTSGPFTTCIGP